MFIAHLLEVVLEDGLLGCRVLATVVVKPELEVAFPLGAYPKRVAPTVTVDLENGKYITKWRNLKTLQVMTPQQICCVLKQICFKVAVVLKSSSHSI